jgi:putative DNA primase/helicase
MAYEFFRGYVPTKDKKCMMGFKGVPDEELLTLEEAEELDEYAGILSETTILVDVDDEEQSEILLNIVEAEELLCRVYKTTRGMHFLFKNVEQTLNKIHANLACGLTADIKLGCKNSYSVLKFKGKTREIIYDILDDEEYEVCPKWLYPIKHRQGLLGMENSDGRNQALFSYILTLQSAGFSVDECKKCISIINRWIFKDPLDESEIDTILRDDSFTKPVFFDNNGKFLFDKFAAYLKTTHHIIKLNGELHIYDKGVYVKGQDVIERAMIEHIPNLNRTKRQEVLSMINLLCSKEKQTIDARYVAFNNCIYDVETDEILDFTPDIVTTNRIPHDYIDGAYDELTDKTLNKLACNDPDIRALLEEVIGYT